MPSPGDRRKITFTENGRSLTFAEVLERWATDAAFAARYTSTLAAAPFAAFFWETPPLTAATLGQPYECMLLDSPSLAGVGEDEGPFSAQLASATAGVASFLNLGKDATLVVPRRLAKSENCAHLAEFLRTASADHAAELWRMTAKVFREKIGSKPLWLSTSGLGVYWVHLRFDSRPKYYSYAPYRDPSYSA